MMKCTMILALLASSVIAAEPAEKDPPPMSEKDKLAVIEAIRPCFVHVEYTMKFDKGEEPRGGSWGSFARYIKQERPMEAPGVLIDARTVIVDDLIIHPRFMKSISVVYNGDRTSARVSGFATKQSVMYLELDKPLRAPNRRSLTRPCRVRT